MKRLSILLATIIALWLSSHSAFAKIITYQGSGGDIPDNCYPLYCDNPSTDMFTSQIFVDQDFVVWDIVVAVDWQHSASSDFIFFGLSGPLGYIPIFPQRPCVDAAGGKFIFNHTYQDPYPGYDYGDIDSCNYFAYPGRYKLHYNHASILGKTSAYGVWQLSIFDGYTWDIGQVNSWSLTLADTTIPAPSALILLLGAVGLIGIRQKRNRE